MEIYRALYDEVITQTRLVDDDLDDLLNLAADLRSEDGENPEYDRALVELCGRFMGLSLGDTHAESWRAAVERAIGVVKPDPSAWPAPRPQDHASQLTVDLPHDFVRDSDGRIKPSSTLGGDGEPAKAGGLVEHDVATWWAVDGYVPEWAH